MVTNAPRPSFKLSRSLVSFCFSATFLKRLIPALSRYNIPAPVAGGLPAAALFAVGNLIDWRPLAFDTRCRRRCRTRFASVGFGASVLLLKRGGRWC